MAFIQSLPAPVLALGFACLLGALAFLTSLKNA